MTKYAILVIETGEYIYRYKNSNTYRSTEELCYSKSGMVPEIYTFNSKKAAELILSDIGKFAFVIIHDKKIFTAENLELFEVVEVHDETV